MDPLDQIYCAGDIIDEQRSTEMVTIAIFFTIVTLVMTLMIMVLLITILMIITVAILINAVGEKYFYHHQHNVDIFGKRNSEDVECVYITNWSLKNMSIHHSVLSNSHHVTNNMYTMHQGPIQCVYTTTCISRVQGNILRGYPPHIQRHSYVYDRIN